MKRIISLLLATCLVITSCGSGPESVNITVTPTSDRLQADILTGNSCTNGGGDYLTQKAPIIVTSAAFSNAIYKSPVTINDVQISYSKYDKNSAAPTTLPIAHDTGFIINPGESKTIEVNVAPENLLRDFVQTYGFIPCSTDIWEYYATITFKGFEDSSRKDFSISTTIKVAFADRNNI